MPESVPEKKNYRPCAAIALFNSEGLVFVGERIDTPGSWQMPQGGIDPGEDIEKAALRELAEETGITKASILGHAPSSITYDLPQTLSGKLWRGKYHGQEQFWVAMRYHGDGSDINLNAHDPAEFSGYQWMNIEETLPLIVPFKQDVYRFVIESFKRYVAV